MSNKVSAIVHKKIFGSSTRKSVMIYFADKASDNGEGIWAAKSTIAAELELHRATVIRTINELVEDGLLIVVGDRKHRNGATVEYDISLPAVDCLPDIELPRADPPQRALDDGLRRRTGRPVAQRDPSHRATPPVAQCDTMTSHSATQTILKPSNNLTRTPARGEGTDPCPESIHATEAPAEAVQGHEKGKGLDAESQRQASFFGGVLRRGGRLFPCSINIRVAEAMVALGEATPEQLRKFQINI